MAFGNINKVTLMGNLGRDPEIRTTQDGTPIANLSIATEESWKDRNTGERRAKVEWHRVVVFGRSDGPGLTKMIGDYLQKGDKAYVEGQLVTRKWQDKDGNDKFTTEIHVRGFGHTVQIIGSKVLDQKRRERGENAGPVDNTPGREQGDFGGSAPPVGGATAGQPLDDEIPF
jgi:single-strand DNA-binding protein